MNGSYDSRCEDLAVVFLLDALPHSEIPTHSPRLAQEIQDTIENYMRSLEDELREARLTAAEETGQ